MPKASPLQGDFSAGEISPLFQGKVDSDLYRSAVDTMMNRFCTLQGATIRRSGTAHVRETKDSSRASRLIPFQFSTTQAYQLEFGHQYIRFYKDNGIITQTAQNITGITAANPAVVTYAGADTYANGDKVIISGVVGMTQVNNREFTVANVNAGANTFELSGINSTSYTAYSSGGTVAEIYEIATTYTEADLFEIDYTQSADTLYLTHVDYAPRKLTRTAHTAWTLSVVPFTDGPYLPVNTVGTTFTPGATTGTTTLTASAVTGINDGAGFATTDVGRMVRIQDGTDWNWVTIAGWTSTTVVTINISTSLPTTNPQLGWRMGAWSDTTGYPGKVTFHEDRLCFAGMEDFPQRIDLSETGVYTSFSPTEIDSATITDSNAISLNVNSSEVNAVRWLTSDEKGLLAGTSGAEWVIKPSSQSEALSPTNVTAKKATSFGSAEIKPVQVGKATLFIQGAGRKLRELTYYYDVDGHRAPDLTFLAEHLTLGGIKEIAYQDEPFPIVWCAHNDGRLLGMSYERDGQVLKVGWHQHELGGVSDAIGTRALVESVSVIPSADGTSQELWMVVRRRINGGTKRFVEYMTSCFTDDMDVQDAFFVDAGATYDSPLTITGATAANPVVITSNSHGLSNGDRVRINEISGMTEINNRVFIAANVAANTFELTGENGTSHTAYISGGEARKMISTVSGLFHLEGQSVKILGDGATQPNATVSSGAITLSTSAAVVQIGLGYNSDLRLLRIEAGAADGTALAKFRRTNKVGLLLHVTGGMKVGRDFDNLDQINFRTDNDQMDTAVPLYSGIKLLEINMGSDTENQLCIRQDEPLPGTIVAIAPRMVTQDG